MDNCTFWVRDKQSNVIHRVGDDQHDSVYVDHEGTLHYHNLQNGDGCGEKSLINDGAGYEFCPMEYQEIDQTYLKLTGAEMKEPKEEENGWKPEWILCKDRLPEKWENVILYYRDDHHTDPSWPKIGVAPAWRCNVGIPGAPKGEWSIEGRLGWVAPLKCGIAWMALPKPEEL